MRCGPSRRVFDPRAATRGVLTERPRAPIRRPHFPDVQKPPVGFVGGAGSRLTMRSLAEAQAQLMPWISRPSLDRLSLRCAGPSGPAERGVGLLDRVTGKRVVVRRGPKEASPKKGRNRFHTEDSSSSWRRRIRDHRRHAPGTVLVRAASLNAADCSSSNLATLQIGLGLSPTGAGADGRQATRRVKLRRWSATQRTRWLNRTRGLLKRARVDEVITALRELCRGRTAGRSARTSTTS